MFRTPLSVIVILLSFSLSFLVILPTPAFALEHWYLPVEPSFKILVVENTSNQSQDLWISGPISLPINSVPEVYYDIPAKSQVELPLLEFLEHPWIHLKANDDSPLKFKISNKERIMGQVSKGNSDHWSSQGLKSGKLHLLNTSSSAQSVHVKLNLKTTKYLMNGFSKLHLTIPQNSLIDIRGEQRLTALLEKNQDWEYLLESKEVLPLKTEKDPKAAYFLFTNDSKSQSFVMKTDSEELKEQARYQIAAPAKYPKKILIGKINKGHGGINRDWYHSNKSAWSWHMSEAVTFSDLASQECDGSPAFVDEFANTWTKSPGVVCFWSYKVFKELTLEQVQKGTNP